MEKILKFFILRIFNITNIIILKFKVYISEWMRSKFWDDILHILHHLHAPFFKFWICTHGIFDLLSKILISSWIKSKFPEISIHHNICNRNSFSCKITWVMPSRLFDITHSLSELWEFLIQPLWLSLFKSSLISWQEWKGEWTIWWLKISWQFEYFINSLHCLWHAIWWVQCFATQTNMCFSQESNNCVTLVKLCFTIWHIQHWHLGIFNFTTCFSLCELRLGHWSISPSASFQIV